MAYWKTGHRKINGVRRKVRILRESGRDVSVRRAGGRVITDRTARKRGLRHVRKFSNNPQRAGRRNFHIHRVGRALLSGRVPVHAVPKMNDWGSLRPSNLVR